MKSETEVTSQRVGWNFLMYCWHKLKVKYSWRPWMTLINGSGTRQPSHHCQLTVYTNFWTTIIIPIVHACLHFTVSALKEGTASTLCLLFSLTYGHHISHLVLVMFPWFAAWLALPPCQPLVAHPHTLHPSPITDLQATRSGNFSKLLFTPLLVLIPLAFLFLLPSPFSSLGASKKYCG